MKRLFFYMNMILFFVTGLFVTSCLNSDSTGSVWDGAGIFRVEGGYLGSGYYFTDSYGNQYIPTYASLAQAEADGFDISEADYAYFYFKWVEDETEVEDKASDTTTTHSFDIELVSSVISIDENEILVAQTKEDMEVGAPETAPIMTMSPSINGSSTDNGPFLFDLDAIILPIYFNMGNTQEAFDMHKFVLACDMSEVTEGSTELNLYLRHDKGDDDEIGYYTSNWYVYDLRYAISEFQAKAGATPTKLVIKAHEDEYQSGDIPNNYTEYKVEYKMPALN